MANNELAIRFTEEMYATKSDVSRELRMSLIDNIWSNILAYRSSFSRYLSLRSIEKNQLSLCLCQSINNKINNVDAKLLKHMGEYFRMNSNTSEQAQFNELCIANDLKYVAKFHNLEINNSSLRSIARGEIKVLDGDFRVLTNYFQALKYIKNRFSNPIDLDYVKGLYQAASGVETDYIFRTTEDSNPNNRVMIDRVYTSAPVNLIDGMMYSLLNFIESSNLSSSVKASTVFYYINYMRPFARYSEEMALLLTKSVLAHIDLAEYSICLPLEKLLDKENVALNKVNLEVQKTNDLTYFINYMNPIYDQVLIEVNDIKTNLSSNEIKRDFYKEEVSLFPEEDEIVEEEIKKEIIEPKPAPQPKPVEIIKPVERVVEKEPIKEEIKVSNPAPAETINPADLGIAYTYIPAQLDEKQAQRLEEHLLELEPSMKKGEAKFYSRHCTMGKKYTIQQYKKALGCAYETARTSMDHLVELGYYRKEMVKNKNVYTPIKQK